ncbi:MAG: hypothetical protein ACYDEV_12250 [Acidiferrobacter sp.]
MLLVQMGLAVPAVVGAKGARWVGLNLAINRYPYVGNDPLNWGDPNGDLPTPGPLVRCFMCAIRLFCTISNAHLPPEMETPEPIQIIRPLGK